MPKMKRFSILMYHSISDPLSYEEKRYACRAETFARHMKFISDGRYNVVSLDHILDSIQKRRGLPDNALAVTLDDGFSDNYYNALPILERYSVPATIFLTAGLLGSTNLWMSSKGFPKRNMLSWDHVKEMLARGISFGSHTMTHLPLTEIESEKARWEIMESKKIIEDRIGRSIKHFAYPFGLFSQSVVDHVRQAGFSLACSTCSGFNQPSTDPLLLHRTEVYGTDNVRQLKRKIDLGTNDATSLLLMHYYLSRLKTRLIEGFAKIKVGSQ